MASVYDNMYFPKSYIDLLNQRRATTGLPSKSSDLEAIVGADLSARYTDASKRRALAIQQQSVDNSAKAAQNQYDLGLKNYDLNSRTADLNYDLGLKNIEASNARNALQWDSYTDMMKAQEKAAMIGNVAKSPSYLMQGYEAGKQLGWWGKTPQIESVYDTLSQYSNYYTGDLAGQSAEGFGTDVATEAAQGGYLANPSIYNNAVDVGTEAATGGYLAPSGTTTAASVPYASYLGPAGWGYAASSLTGKAVGEAIGSTLDVGGERERSIGGGIATGAAAGATAGSIIPGVGTAIGGVIGGIVGGVTQLADDSVICTELHRQGLLPREVYLMDSAFGQALSPETIRGYQRWAIPVVNAMRKSRAITRIVNLVVRPVINEMAHRMDATVNGSFYGKCALAVGIPFCRWLGEERPMLDGYTTANQRTA